MNILIIKKKNYLNAKKRYNIKLNNDKNNLIIIISFNNQLIIKLSNYQ